MQPEIYQPKRDSTVKQMEYPQHLGKKGRTYYVRGWTPHSDATARTLRTLVYKPKTHCAECKGKGYVFDHDCNKHRTHFMRYSACGWCKGTGRITNGEA